jgi:hypothetical protein
MGLKVIVRGLWDRVGGWLLILLGGLALLLGWLGVADTPLTSEQMPYVISGGMFGLALIGTGTTLLLSSDLRDEWRKLDDIEHAIRQGASVAFDGARSPGAEEATPPLGPPGQRRTKGLRVGR